jgi:UDP-N-acetylglucosamine--N-acetylmuramyl-(pentapeptide) pyrophosphoryl-undecaprenol N-acetylglucosamine transferase
MTADVHLVGSAGGHLDLLRSVREVFARHRRLWVTAPGARAEALVRHGEKVALLPDPGRDPRRASLAVAAAVQLAHRERPRLIVTSGAGLAVPFCLAARAGGARLIFIETMARVSNASRSGRVLSRIADATVVQWPEMQTVYPGARLCRPALLDHVGATPDGQRRSGTFVAVGTHRQAFDRLLHMVDNAAEAGLLPQPVRAQVGTSSFPARHYTATPWMRSEEIEQAVAQSELVVCHAGSGIVSTALRAGRRPLVLARLRREGEHNDDHQEQLADKLAQLGVVVRLRDGISQTDVAAARSMLVPVPPSSVGTSVAEALERELRRLSTDRGGRDARWVVRS